MESVCDHGIYGNVGGRIFYHHECLQMVEMEPEKFGHIVADKAININDLRKDGMKFNEKLEGKFKRKVEQLQRNHFERMLPSWKKKR